MGEMTDIKEIIDKLKNANIYICTWQGHKQISDYYKDFFYGWGLGNDDTIKFLEGILPLLDDEGKVKTGWQNVCALSKLLSKYSEEDFLTISPDGNFMFMGSSLDKQNDET